MDDIFLTVNWDRDPPTVLVIVRESHNPNAPARLCDVGSRMVREHFETIPYGGEDAGGYRQRRYAEFRRQASALAAILETSAAALLTPKNRAAIADTEGDRQLANAIAAGAKMDPETGCIPGVD